MFFKKEKVKFDYSKMDVLEAAGIDIGQLSDFNIMLSEYFTKKEHPAKIVEKILNDFGSEINKKNIIIITMAVEYLIMRSNQANVIEVILNPTKH